MEVRQYRREERGWPNSKEPSLDGSLLFDFMPLLVFLFEELVERVYLAVNFNRELTGHRAVENRDVAHSPFDSAVVKNQ